MLVSAAVAAFFKFKIASSIVILACGDEFDHLKLLRQLSQHGVSATVTCEPAVLDHIHNRLQGVLYIQQPNDTLLDKVRLDHFAIWYKWLVVAAEIPTRLHEVRYDSDITLLDFSRTPGGMTREADEVFEQAGTAKPSTQAPVSFEDLYVHARGGASRHPWATWTEARGFQLEHERARLLRRFNLEGYPMRIPTPIGQYDEERYGGSFAQYVSDESMPERDSAIRCSFAASSLIVQALNAKVELVQVQLWASEMANRTSMLAALAGGAALSGSVLRVTPGRLARCDYVMPLWPFAVGFTYLSERESSSNMFVMPFSGGVWGACLAVALVLAAAQRATARAPQEREGAFIAVLATWLQQDASAVPEGASGRLTFLVLSASSMLVHAYYTSAVVSALMGAGGGGPASLRALADSRYHIASEDYEWMRYLMFDVETTWDDLEYLKRKKKTASFYQSAERGMRQVRAGSTAFHAEYNSIYPLLRDFQDQQICRLQAVDTIPEVMSWLVSTKRGQWTELLRSAGDWLREAGLARRLVARWRVRPPACRAARNQVMSWLVSTKRGQWTELLRSAGDWLREAGLARRLVARWRVRPPACRAARNQVMSWLVSTKRGQWTELLRSAGDWLREAGLARRLVARWRVRPPACRAARNQVMSWLVSTKRGQWTELLRSAGDWLREAGLARRLVARWRVRPPACRAALLAERVKHGDVAPLLALTALGFAAALVFLVLEILVDRWKPKRKKHATVEVDIN